MAKAKGGPIKPERSIWRKRLDAQAKEAAKPAKKTAKPKG